MTVPSIKALVPIKKHSERIPGKNIRPFCGQPLFHWILLSLSKSKFVQTVIIDTDSDEIGTEVTKLFDAKILHRPKHLHGDHVGINSLIAHQLSEVEGEYFLQTHTTNPLLTTQTIDDAIEKFFSMEEFDSLFSVTRLQARIYSDDGKPLNHDPNHMVRTQELDPIWEENSNLYLFSRKSFEKSHHRIGRKPFLYPMSRLEAVDIDTEEEFMLAEGLMRQRLEGSTNV